MKTIQVKLNDYNSPTELPTSIIDLLNDENTLLDKIKVVEENKVIIREEILQKEGDALKVQLELIFSKIGMSVIGWTSNVNSNEYRVEVGFDYSKTITFLLEVTSAKNEELSRGSRLIWEYGTELSLYVFSTFKYYNKNNISELWGNGCNRHNNYKECGSYTDFDINSFMERNFNCLKELITSHNNR
tara:strand:+ start:900 stop:1460 length:561 start_codon:yes stop_codon:yes gene_type:complete